MTLQQGWKLAKEWYSDRLSPQWVPKTADEAQSAFGQIGLTGKFWELKTVEQPKPRLRRR
jgi:hypothetical protein